VALAPPLGLPSGIRPVRHDDVGRLSHVLARAFRDDPTHRWFFPSEHAWRRHSHRSFALLLRDNLATGTVLTNDRLEGAALWNEPSAPEPGALQRLLFGMRMLRHFGAHIPRAIRGFQVIAEAQPRQRKWYLSVIGTDPPRQGRGVGRALIEPALARADAEELPAWLEASRPENVPYYQRFGFEVTHEIPLPEGPPLFGMLRKPRAGGTRPESGPESRA
jgi:ribosomal protein S18 acetylase RimI-like enzyme